MIHPLLTSLIQSAHLSPLEPVGLLSWDTRMILEQLLESMAGRNGQSEQIIVDGFYSNISRCPILDYESLLIIESLAFELLDHYPVESLMLSCIIARHPERIVGANTYLCEQLTKRNDENLFEALGRIEAPSPACLDVLISYLSRSISPGPPYPQAKTTDIMFALICHAEWMRETLAQDDRKPVIDALYNDVKLMGTMAFNFAVGKARKIINNEKIIPPVPGKPVSTSLAIQVYANASFRIMQRDPDAATNYTSSLLGGLFDHFDKIESQENSPLSSELHYLDRDAFYAFILKGLTHDNVKLGFAFELACMFAKKEMVFPRRYAQEVKKLRGYLDKSKVDPALKAESMGKFMRHLVEFMADEDMTYAQEDISAMVEPFIGLADIEQLKGMSESAWIMLNNVVIERMPEIAGEMPSLAQRRALENDLGM